MPQNKQVHGGGQKNAAPTHKNGSPSKSGNQPKKGAGKAVPGSVPAEKKSTAGVVAVVAALLVVGAIVVVSAQGGGNSTQGGVRQPSTEEAAYIGRLLPADYTPPAVAAATTYGSTVEMTELTATLTDTQVTVPVAEVIKAKIALFQYEGAGSLPIIAYVKPSGALFVGVSFCPPCQGEWQTIQADGTLTCNSCGTKRDLETQAGISGACKLYPLDELPVTMVDGAITIDRAILDTWSAQPLDRKVG